MSSYRQRTTQHTVAAAFPILLASLFLIFSALFEVIPGIRETRPQLILGTIGLLILFTSGQFIRVVTTPVGKSLLIFTVWFLFCIPFAVWRGGSAGLFINKWYKTVLMFILTAGLLSTVRQAKKLFHAIGYAVAVTAVLALAEHTYEFGRLTLPNSRYANSNDLAVSLLVGLTFLLYSFRRGTRRERTIAVVLSVPVLVALAKTGSRAALLGVAMLYIFGFLQASAKNRMKMVASVPLLFIAFALVLSSGVRQRYFTLFTSSSLKQMTAEERREYVAATGSAEARLKLLKDSLIITFQHPLLGVGPGNFVVEQNNLAIARGERGMWHVTHNTYTQVSSEMGIPGLILYLIFLRQTLKVLTSIIRSEESGEVWPDLRALALSLRSGLVVLATVALFDSFPYMPDVPIIAGLAVALGYIAEGQRSTDMAARATVAITGRPTIRRRSPLQNPTRHPSLGA